MATDLASPPQAPEPPSSPTPPVGDDRIKVVAGLVAVGAALLLLVAAIASVRQGDGDDVGSAAASEDGDGWGGTRLGPAQPRPDFTLTDTEGQPFDFRAETQGRLTLLFFGYTNCPDICPVQMAVLSGALDSPGMPEATVVFVTTDPARDTPDRLRQWLDTFDASYVGLTGTPEEIDRAEQAAGVAGSLREPDSAGDDDYEVGHAAQVIAYTPDDQAHLAYPAGVRQQDWTADLPRMLERWGGPEGES